MPFESVLRAVVGQATKGPGEDTGLGQSEKVRCRMAGEKGNRSRSTGRTRSQERPNFGSISHPAKQRGGTMLRKQIIKPPPETPAPMPGEIDIAATATVRVTSESTEHPVDHAFDSQRGPGATRWVAGGPGEQAVIL